MGSELESAGGSAEGAGEKFGGLKDHLGELAVAAVGVGSVMGAGEFLSSSVDKVEEMATSVSKLSRTMGATPEDASRMKFAIGEAVGAVGGNTDAATNSMAKFAKQLAGLSDPQQQAAQQNLDAVTKSIEKLGVSTTDADGNMRPLADIQADLQDKLGGTSAGAKTVASDMDKLGQAVQALGGDPTQIVVHGSQQLIDNFQRLGIATTDAHGAALPMTSVLGQLADKFQAMPDGAQKTALAMQLFGRQGADLIPFLDRGSAGIADLEKESDKLGLTLSGNTIDQVQKLREAHQQLGAAMEGLQVTVGTLLIPGMVKIAEASAALAVAFNENVVPAIKQGATWFQDHLLPVIAQFGNYLGTQLLVWLNQFEQLWRERINPALIAFGQFFADHILPVILQFGGYLRDNLLPPLQQFGDWLSQHQEIIAALGVAVAAVTAAMGAMAVVMGVATVAMGAFGIALAVVTSPITLIVLAVAGLVLGIIELKNHWDDITTAVPAIGVAFQNVQQVLSAFLDWLKTPFGPDSSAVFSGIITAAKTVTQWFTDHWHEISDIFKPQFEILSAVVVGTFDQIKDVIQTQFDLIKGMFTVVMDVIHGNFSQAWTDLLAIPKQFFADIQQLLTDQFATVESIISGVWDQIKATAQVAWDAFGTIIKQTIADVLSEIQALPGQILQGIGNLSGLLDQAGKDLIQGFINGIESMLKGVTDTINGIVNAIPGAVKTVLKIFSPSQVMYDLGTQIMLGLTNGISDGSDRTSIAMAAAIAQLDAIATQAIAKAGADTGNLWMSYLTAAQLAGEQALEQARLIAQNLGPPGTSSADLGGLSLLQALTGGGGGYQYVGNGGGSSGGGTPQLGQIGSESMAGVLFNALGAGSNGSGWAQAGWTTQLGAAIGDGMVQYFNGLGPGNASLTPWAQAGWNTQMTPTSGEYYTSAAGQQWQFNNGPGGAPAFSLQGNPAFWDVPNDPYALAGQRPAQPVPGYKFIVGVGYVPDTSQGGGGGGVGGGAPGVIGGLGVTGGGGGAGSGGGIVWYATPGASFPYASVHQGEYGAQSYFPANVLIGGFGTGDISGGTLGGSSGAIGGPFGGLGRMSLGMEPQWVLDFDAAVNKLTGGSAFEQAAMQSQIEALYRKYAPQYADANAAAAAANAGPNPYQNANNAGFLAANAGGYWLNGIKGGTWVPANGQSYVPWEPYGGGMTGAAGYLWNGGAAQAAPQYTINISALDASGVKSAIPEILRQLNLSLQQAGANTLTATPRGV